MTGGQHPAWCSPARCDVDPALPADGGTHRSEPVSLNLRSALIPGARMVSVSLIQVVCLWPTSVYLVLASGADELLSMPLDEAAGTVADLSELIAKGSVTP